MNERTAASVGVVSQRHTLPCISLLPPLAGSLAACWRAICQRNFSLHSVREEVV